jgi:alpha,alpha-trehalose phosphorylase
MCPQELTVDAPGLDPWPLIEDSADPARTALHESMFTLGNGCIEVSGGHEEGAVWPGASGDSAVCLRDGLAAVGVPDGRAVRWWVDGEPFDPSVGRLEAYRRHLDLRSGLLAREFVWASPRGRRIEVRSTRVVCLERPHLFAIEYELRPLGDGVRLVLESTLDAQVLASAPRGDPRTRPAGAARGLLRTGYQRAGGRVVLLHARRDGGLRVASGIEQTIHVAAASAVMQEECGGEGMPGLSYSVSLPAGARAILTKYCALASSFDAPVGLSAFAARQLSEARAKGFSALCAEQRASLARFWARTGAAPGGDAQARQRVHLAQWRALQARGRDGGGHC